MTSLKKISTCTILHMTGGGFRAFITLRRVTVRKKNVIVWLEFEVAYYDATVQHFSHSSGELPSFFKTLILKFENLNLHDKQHLLAIWILAEWGILVEPSNNESYSFGAACFYGVSSIVGYLMPYPTFTYLLNIWFVNTFCRYTQFNMQTVLFLTIQFSISRNIKRFQVLLCITNNSIKYLGYLHKVKFTYSWMIKSFYFQQLN